jgi:CRP/FNR family transcriptional regulator, nitrogen fixation regulation protein
MAPETSVPAGDTRITTQSGSHALANAIKLKGILRNVEKNVEVYGENEPAEQVYQVVSGMVRTYKIGMEGRRIVGAFYHPGDILALDGGRRHLFSAEAVVDSEVRVVKRSILISLAEQEVDVARDLWLLTATELQRTQNHMLLLNKTASERVASFLLEMCERIQSRDEIHLAMSRQDVADYLGLTSETISRMLTRFADTSAIALPTCRRIVVRNLPSLRRLVA